MLAGNTQKIGEERLVNGGRTYVCTRCWMLDSRCWMMGKCLVYSAIQVSRIQYPASRI